MLELGQGSVTCLHSQDCATRSCKLSVWTVLGGDPGYLLWGQRVGEGSLFSSRLCSDLSSDLDTSLSPLTSVSPAVKCK